MSLWYDKNKNEYASDGRSGWLKAFCEKTVGDTKSFCLTLCKDTCAKLEKLYNECKDLLDKHFIGTAGRHTAADIDYSESQTVKEKIDSEVQNRVSAISAEASARQSAISAESSARQNAITAEASARQSAVSAEASARETADGAIETKVRNEESARKAADTLLRTDINNLAASMGVIVDSNVLTADDLSAEVLVEDGYLLPISVVSRNGNKWNCKIDLSSIELNTKLFCCDKSDWGVGEYTFDITAEAEGETFQVYLEVNTIRGTSDVWVEKAAQPPFPSMVDVDGTMQFWICQFIIEAYDSNSPELDINNCTEHETVDLRELTGYYFEHFCSELSGVYDRLNEQKIIVSSSMPQDAPRGSICMVTE